MLPFDPSTILPSSILAVTDFWMARWLTPMWFLGIGVIGGLLLLGLLLGLFYVLSLIGKPLDALRETGVAHIIAGLITLALTSVYGLWVGGFLKSFYQQFPTDEFVLLVLAGAIVFAIFSWSLLFCSSTRFFKELRALLFEGVGFYMLCVLGVLSVLSLAVSPLIDQPRAAFNSLPYLLFLKSGVQTDTYKIPGITGDQEAPFTKIDFRYDPRTLSELVLESDKNLLIGDAPSIADFRIPGSRLESGVETRWNRNMGADKAPVPLAQGAEVYVQNQEFGEATLKIRMGSEPPVRQSVTFVWVAVFVAILGLFFMLMQAIAPKTAAIALATAKSEQIGRAHV